MVTVTAAIFIGIAGYQVLSIKLGLSPMDRGMYFENSIIATLSNKNFLAETLLLMLPFQIFCGVIQRGPKQILSIITIAGSLALIVLIQSLAVYTALGVSAITFLLVYSISGIRNISKSTGVKKVPLVVLVIIIAFVSAAGLFFYKLGNGNPGQESALLKKFTAVRFYVSNPGLIFDQSTGANNNSVYDRIYLAKNSLKMAGESVVTGVGTANWNILFPKYGVYNNSFLSTGRMRFEHPHNDYLFILCEWGTTGLLLWILLVTASICFAFKVMSVNKARELKWLMILMVVCIVSFAVISLFSYPRERFYSMLVFVMALSVIGSHIPVREKQPHQLQITFFITGGITVLLILWVMINRYYSEVCLFTALKFQKNQNLKAAQIFGEKAINRFHHLDITGTPVRWHVGQAYYYEGNQQKALSNYLAAERQNPYHVNILNDIGAVYENQKEHTLAIRYFDRVFELIPGYSDAVWNMIAVNYNTGKLDEAFNSFIKIKPRYTDKWRETMDILLIAKAQRLVESSQDSVLANEINRSMAAQRHFLLEQFHLAEQSGVSFESQLQSLVPAHGRGLTK